MTAKVVKARMLWWLLYRFGYHAAVTEFSGLFGIADVYASTKAHYDHEIEVKVSKADLMTELYAIERELKGDRSWKGKGTKHRTYLGKGERLFLGVMAQNYTPNKFSFAVPYELVDIALKYLENTPYGLYRVAEDRNYVERVKRADFLHKEKVTEKRFMSLIRKTCTEIQALREKEALSN